MPARSCTGRGDGAPLLERLQRTTRVVGVLIATLLAGCGNAAGPESVLVIEAEGRLERNGAVSIRALLGGQILSDSQVSWRGTPSDAVEFLPGGTAKFLRATSVTITASTVAVVRVDGALTVDIAVPPTIVFDFLVNRNRDIYRAALDGGDLARLTTDPGDDRDPSSSGGLVVFVSFRDGNGELYSVPLSGGNETRLTATATPVHEGDPAYSAGVGRIAFTRPVGCVPKLWTAAPDGSGAGRITTSFGFGGSIEASPSWDPAGAHVVFMATNTGNADLFAYTVSDASFASLGADSAASPDVEPAWSNDGSKIVFASQRGGQADLYSLDVGVGRTSQLTNRTETDAQPAWLPDGRIVYTSWDSGQPRLRWLDPTQPDSVHDIDVGAGAPQRPSGAL